MKKAMIKTCLTMFHMSEFARWVQYKHRRHAAPDNSDSGQDVARNLLGNTASIRFSRHPEEDGAGHEQGRTQEFMSRSCDVGDSTGFNAQRRWRGDNTQRREESARSAGLSSRELFAPAPSDPEWAEVIKQHPYLSPAVFAQFDERTCETQLSRALRCAVAGVNRRARRIASRRLARRLALLFAEATTQSGVLGVVDGLAMVVDESRSHQLRAVGNGVVPLQVAAAFVLLIERIVT